MSCSKCEYAPKTYEEYCISKKQPQSFCPDAYTEKAQYCGNYEKQQAESEECK